jgi:hypothetical protein
MASIAAELSILIKRFKIDEAGQIGVSNVDPASFLRSHVIEKPGQSDVAGTEANYLPTVPEKARARVQGA